MTYAGEVKRGTEEIIANAIEIATQKCKKTVTKTGSQNSSTRAKNRDETAFFTLARGHFSLFPRSKHSFYRPKAMLLHRNRYALSG